MLLEHGVLFCFRSLHAFRKRDEERARISGGFVCSGNKLISISKVLFWKVQTVFFVRTVLFGSAGHSTITLRGQRHFMNLMAV